MFKKISILIALLYLSTCTALYGQTFIRNLSSANSFVKLGNSLYFAGGDATQGYGLWKTDGTVAGTVLVKKTGPGSVPYPIANLVVYKNKIYFAANDGINGQELWVSDGTATGTVLFKDINPAHVGNTGSQPGQFTVCNNMLFFTASLTGNYNSLWKTDGTVAGTIPLTQDNYFGVGQLTAVGNILYFQSSGLWKSDGSVAGTKQINVDDNSTVDLLHNVNNQLVFITNTSYRQSIRLYTLNPPNDNLVLLKTYTAVTYGSNDIDNITPVGNNFYYSIRTVDANNKALDALWVSDGTAAGTHIVKSYDWTSYMSGSYIQNFFAFNNKLYFVLTSAKALYTSDGSDAGTIQVSTNALQAGHGPVLSNQKLFFTGTDGGIYSFDGTTVKQEISQPSAVDQLTDLNGVLYFTSSKSNSTDIWNNTPMGQMQVTVGYSTIATGGLFNFTSRVDSAVTYPVTVKNTGNKELVLSDIGVVGSPFYVNGQPSKTILPGKQTSFNLIYDPAKEEESKGVLQIKNNDSANGLFNISLTGTTMGTAKNRGNIPANGLLKTIAFNDSIPAFTLTGNTIAESAAVNTTIGTFQVSSGTGTYQYALINGTGDQNNSSFKIENGQLKTVGQFDFETKNTYTIRVRASNGTLSYDKSFTLTVTDVQEDPANPGCGFNGQDLSYTLDDVAYAGSSIIAVGSRGNILKSDNDGVDWSIVNTGVGSSFNTIKMIDDHIGYIMSYEGTMLKTEDGGNNWFPIESPDTAYPYLNHMVFSSALTGYIFSDYKLYKTINGGKTWKKLNFNGSGLTGGWFIDDNNGFICGGSQTLLHTTDGGVSWTNITTASLGFNIGFSSIAFVNATTGFLATTSGALLQTQDSGLTWSKVGAVSANYIPRMIFQDAKTGYILSNGGTVFKTIDGGVTWTSELSSNNALLGLAYNAAKNKYCLVGHGLSLGSSAEQGRCIYLKDGAGAWAVRSVIDGGDYYTENVVDDKTAYVFGSNNIKTTDGGITWKKINAASDTYNSIRNSSFTSKDVGYYADLYHAYKTINGGDTWTQLNIPNFTYTLAIAFLNENIGFISTDDGLYKTSDAGTTWIKTITYNSLGGITDIAFANQQVAFGVGRGSNIYKTTDQGNTWTITSIPGSLYFTSCYFFDTQTGLIGGTNGTLLRTTDGGTTWTPIYTPAILTFYGFTFLDKLHGFAITNHDNSGVSEIYETFDAGLTWARLFQSGNGISQTATTNGSIFIIGDGGYITKYSNAPLAPANAGYIKGDTLAVSGIKTTYSAPAVANTNYRWTIQGAASVTYQNNSVIVLWNKGGTYTVQATPYNNCGSGTARTLSVNVQDMPDPVITGADSVFSKSTNIIYTAAAHTGNTYEWAVTGGTQVINNNQTNVNWGDPGAGLVTVAETNLSFNIKKSATKKVAISGSAFSLPANNFTVFTNGSTCKGTNNGSISVKALQKLNYIGTLTSPDNSGKGYTFTDSLKVAGLVPGNYNLCITVAGNNDFQRCYTLSVTEPKDLSVYSVVDKLTQSLTLNITGADVYHVEINGQSYQTNNNQINLKLANGANRVKVYTDKLCQGIFEKTVDFNMVSIYPNPTARILHIDLGGNQAPQANVEIRNSLGKLMLAKTFPNNGVIQADIGNLDAGIYVLKLVLGTQETTYKILKQ
ncbi:MAG: ELWxxDGT repeat protein [Mucilaginibacter sp.]|uniref:ELWxxDGT repeat protein n=1 Tax=Mucilaginibacter sp. TaxID=1882438 RepID=UPI0031AC905C